MYVISVVDLFVLVDDVVDAVVVVRSEGLFRVTSTHQPVYMLLLFLLWILLIHVCDCCFFSEKKM